MDILTTPHTFHNARKGMKGSVALVPTMGALHDGHAAVIKRAVAESENTVVSIFVNPTQFRANEDFGAYPRTLEQDCLVCDTLGAKYIYAPKKDDLYQPSNTTTLATKGAADGLESTFRPGFFNGVIQIVSKLFNTVQPDAAYFGEKDYQQLCVIKQLVKDMDYPIAIKSIPTVREPSGLALSSRNRYLSTAEQKSAVRLYKTLTAAAYHIKHGEEIQNCISTARKTLLTSGFHKVDYIACRHSETLARLSDQETNAPKRLLAAAWCGKTRLIDNIAV